MKKNIITLLFILILFTISAEQIKISENNIFNTTWYVDEFNLNESFNKSLKIYFASDFSYYISSTKNNNKKNITGKFQITSNQIFLIPNKNSNTILQNISVKYELHNSDNSIFYSHCLIPITNAETYPVFWNKQKKVKAGSVRKYGHTEIITLENKRLQINENVNIRNSPSLKGSKYEVSLKEFNNYRNIKYSYLPKGSIIKLIARTTKKEKINKWNNYWYLVQISFSNGDMLYLNGNEEKKNSLVWMYGEFFNNQIIHDYLFDLSQTEKGDYVGTDIKVIRSEYNANGNQYIELEGQIIISFNYNYIQNDDSNDNNLKLLIYPEKIKNFPIPYQFKYKNEYSIFFKSNKEENKKLFYSQNTTGEVILKLSRIKISEPDKGDSISELYVDEIIKLKPENGKLCNTIIYENKVNIRKSPSLKSDIIGSGKIGEPINIIEKTNKVEIIYNKKDSWYKVRCKGKIGYLWGGLIADNWIYINKKNNEKFLIVKSKNIITIPTEIIFLNEYSDKMDDKTKKIINKFYYKNENRYFTSYNDDHKVENLKYLLDFLNKSEIKKNIKITKTITKEYISTNIKHILNDKTVNVYENIEQKIMHLIEYDENDDEGYKLQINYSLSLINQKNFSPYTLMIQLIQKNNYGGPFDSYSKEMKIFSWNKNKISMVFSDFLGGQGHESYASSTYIFPDDPNGEKNTIILLTNYGFKTRYLLTKKYLWDGKNFNLIFKEDKELNEY